jgi:hypothetical protein
MSRAVAACAPAGALTAVGAVADLRHTDPGRDGQHLQQLGLRFTYHLARNLVQAPHARNQGI